MKLRVVSVVSVLLFTACGKRSEDSEAASVSIKPLQDLDYDKMKLKVSHEDGNLVTDQEFSKDKNRIEESYQVGTYHFEMEYFKAEDVIAASHFCEGSDLKSRVHTLKPGSNEIKVIICKATGEPISADVVIEPVLKDGSETTDGNALATVGGYVFGDRGEGLEPNRGPWPDGKGSACFVGIDDKPEFAKGETADHIKRLKSGGHRILEDISLQYNWDEEQEVRQKIKSIVEAEINQKLPIKFEGWQECGERRKGELRILISFSYINNASSTVGYDTVRGDQQDLTIWTPNVVRKWRAKDYDTAWKTTLLHEFGHTMGLRHTYDRPDAPWDHYKDGDEDLTSPYNNGASRVAHGAFTIGDYDSESIMGRHNRSNSFSQGDRHTLFCIYDDSYAQNFEVACKKTLDGKNPSWKHPGADR
ncbi:hypothetical protein [Pseudobacteriovorax antillogorgiicola]|uniref:Peptidase metallopeptidase domain-containing protein n=1 Tax=Pseudobacteriovorax antillogorgiicola TaxID=1513793 RepID=A0A1Y6BJ10_9BACT|nr:hypothetical protein [Pseudobacteriovorax antillogorgiicola]TCS56364.1 hypothetical protein EDD56_104186 [Pseudobacteriovorax antillogorgiicola]SMF06657.1 hypothetical protein SAMN06296036_104147 [Pseudobacteriovorax antillogorgiicola]